MSIRFKKETEIFDSELGLRGLNLLAHAQLIELEIGSQCGGYGRCGKDVVYLKESDRLKVSRPTEIEKRHLPEEQLAVGARLACQCFPNEDGIELEISLPKST